MKRKDSNTWLDGKSPLNRGFDRKITDKWSIVHCCVWLPEGIINQITLSNDYGHLYCNYMNWMVASMQFLKVYNVARDETVMQPGKFGLSPIPIPHSMPFLQTTSSPPREKPSRLTSFTISISADLDSTWWILHDHSYKTMVNHHASSCGRASKILQHHAKGCLRAERNQCQNHELIMIITL